MPKNSTPANDNLEFVAGYVNNLSFREACFEQIVCFGVIEHLDNPSRVVGEMERVLREGGMMCLLALLDTGRR